MPRTKSLAHYPSRYAEIIRECGVGGKTIRVTLPTHGRALSMRGHWYAYIGALKSEVARIKKSQVGIPSAGEQDIMELLAQSPMVMLQVEAHPDGSADVVWQNRENSWQAQALAKAQITTSDSQPTSTSLDDIASRLMRVQQEMENDDDSKLG